jgi:alpha-tubulin suppressor-like RCC1 family protein
MAVGGYHTLFLFHDSLWTMGYNFYGQLGNGIFSTSPPYGYNVPGQIVASGVTAIAAGADHSLFLESDGSLWAMGYDVYGQLGDGLFGNGSSAREQIVPSGVTAIAAGFYHSLFLKSDGSLWGMGYNHDGELGGGTFSATNRPEKIVAGGVTAIAAGSLHSLFLKSDGSLWAMGYNLYGQLGDGTTNNAYLPEQIVASGVAAISAGADHSLFLKSDGSLWAMGNNVNGQLGDGTTNRSKLPEQIVASGVTAISAGVARSLFLKSDGSLWGMGYNLYGELGDGFVDNIPPNGTATPEQIFPKPQPRLNSTLSSNTNLQTTATCGFGGNFALFGSTNLSQPLSQWIPLRTNTITARGTNNFSVTLTNALNSGGQQFYILQSQ